MVTTTTSAVPPAPSTTSGAPAQNDEARARAALLAASDFPTGWTSQPADTAANAGNDAALRACLKLPANSPLFSESSNRASSPDFVHDNVSVHNDASVSSAARVQAAFAVLSRSDFVGCLGPVIRSVAQTALAKSTLPASVDSVKVDGLTVRSNAPLSKAFRTTLVVTVGGQKTSIYVDIAYVASQDISSSITFQALQSPVDAATETQYTNIVVGRLR